MSENSSLLDKVLAYFSYSQSSTAAWSLADTNQSSVYGNYLLQSQLFNHACTTPLTILLHNLESAVQENPDSRVRTQLQQSLVAAKQLQALLAHLHTVPKERFSFVISVKQVIRLLNRSLPGAIIKFDSSCSRSVRLYGSKLHFQEALVSVIKNAFEAYPSEDKNKTVIVSVRQTGGMVRLDVVDFAKGIPPHLLDRVSQQGVSTKRQTGLGLYFAQQTIQQLFQGTFEVTSTPRKGTHITWLLPLYREPSSQNPE